MKFGKSIINPINRSNSSLLNRGGLLQKEFISNENIFKPESDYKMKQDLSFHENEEQTCKRNLFMRYNEIVKMMIVYACLKNIYYFSCEFCTMSIFLSLLRLPNLLILLFSALMIINVDKFINHSLHIRLFLECDIILNIIMNEITQATVENVYTPFGIIFTKFGLGLTYNFSFGLAIHESIYFYTLETMTILSFLGMPERYFITRFILNLISLKGLMVLISLFCVITIQFLLSKAQRELWALYDSFKRSYFNIKNIYDEFPLPVFIVKRQTFQIYYKNLEADKLYIKNKYIKIGEKPILKGRSKRAPAKMDYNFKDIFEKSLEKLLENEIEKCLKNDIKYFDFPMLTGDKKIKYKESDTYPTTFEGDLEYIKWVKVYLNQCTWKGNESIMVSSIFFFMF
jgi:hypothetical protein